MKNFSFLLLFFAASTFIPAQNPCPGIPTVTYSGKTYSTVQIGTQCWLKENLDVGNRINGNVAQANNGVIEKYCYDDKVENCDTYGGLYLWAEAVQYKNGATNTESANPAFSGNVQGICPSGWHIPTAEEFGILRTTANNKQDAVLAVGQARGTNTSGFSALMAGYSHYDNYFSNLGIHTYFWSSTEYIKRYSFGMHLHFNIIYIDLETNYKNYGFNVRCLKDEPTSVSDNQKELLKNYSLSQNYPNPFNPETVISYELAVNCYVTLKIFDALGRDVETLVDEFQQAGIYNSRFSIKDSQLPSGVYYYRLQAGDYASAKKMILLK